VSFNSFKPVLSLFLLKDLRLKALFLLKDLRLKETSHLKT